MQTDCASRALIELAASRHNAFTTSEAADLGIKQPRLRKAELRNEMFRVYPSVWAYCGLPADSRHRLHAATLALPGSAASRLSAAWLHGLRDPHNYATLVPTCAGCNFDTQTIQWSSGDALPTPWNLPTAHPGLQDPMSIYTYLLNSLDNGADVTAEFGPDGRATSYSVDGFGADYSCFISDTLPANLVIVYKANGQAAPGSYCGYGE